MSLYTNSVQRNRYNLYLFSGNARQQPLAGGTNPGQCFYSLRRSGYVYKPELYQGCIVGVNTFISNGTTDAVANDLYQGGDATGPPATQNGQGSSIHVVLANVGGQPNGAFNLNKGPGGISTGADPSAYNTPNILCSLGWNNLSIGGAGGANITTNLQYSCQGGDPVSNGIFIPGPFDEFELQLRFNDWSIVNLIDAAVDDAGAAKDMEYFCHLVVQPVLKSYEVPVDSTLRIDGI